MIHDKIPFVHNRLAMLLAEIVEGMPRDNTGWLQFFRKAPEDLPDNRRVSRSFVCELEPRIPEMPQTIAGNYSIAINKDHPLDQLEEKGRAYVRIRLPHVPAHSSSHDIDEKNQTELYDQTRGLLKQIAENAGMKQKDKPAEYRILPQPYDTCTDVYLEFPPAKAAQLARSIDMFLDATIRTARRVHDEQVNEFHHER